MPKRQTKKITKTKAIAPSTPKETTMDQQALTELTEANKAQAEQIEQLKNKLEAAQSEAKDFHDRIEKALDKAARYQQVKDNAITELKETRFLAEQKSKEANEKLDKANDKVKKAQAKMKEIREEHSAEKTALINAHAAELTDLQQQLQQQQDKGNNMSDQQTTIDNLKQKLNQANEDKKAMNKEMENLKQEIEQLKNELKEAREINTGKEESNMTIENLRTELANATADSTEAKTQLDKAKSELLEVTKWNSKHTMKVAGAVVGMIILVAGVAYVVRRVLANGEAEVEAIDTEAAPELSVVNY